MKMLNYFLRLSIVACLGLIVFTGCQKENLVRQSEEVKIKQSEKSWKDTKVTGFAIPALIAERGNLVIQEYLSSLDANELKQSLEKYQLTAFLTSRGGTDRVTKLKDERSKFSLNNYLSEEELSDFKSFIEDCDPNSYFCQIPPETNYFYLKHVWEELCCINSIWYVSGPLYQCRNNGWVYMQEFDYNTEIGCSGSGCLDIDNGTAICSVDFEYICNGVSTKQGPINSKAQKNLSTFFASEISESVKKIMNVYIKHSGQINDFFQSEDSKYDNLRAKYEDFVSANIPLINQSFEGANFLTIEEKNLRPTLLFLTEMKKVVNNPILEKEIEGLISSLSQTEGKSLKEALRIYRQ